MKQHFDTDNEDAMTKILTATTIFLFGVIIGSFAPNDDPYQPIPEDNPVVISAYNTTVGEYVVEIGRLDQGYTVCMRERGFTKSGEDVFGGFTCSHYPEKEHPVVKDAKRDQSNESTNSTNQGDRK